MLPDEGRRPDNWAQQPPQQPSWPPQPPAPPQPAVPPQGAGVQRCYRHPAHETGVACTRCGRPICPLCMVNASVGFHCPECVHGGPQEGRPGAPQGVRQVRTAPGSRLPHDPALVTKVLIGINAALFLLVQLLGPSFQYQLVLVGKVFDQGELVGVATGPGQWYRLITAAFMHWSWWHLGLNMLSLWWIGPQLENALGRLRYLALYLVSALAGSALSYLVAGAAVNTAGASGAIFGLLGATVVLHRLNGYPLGPIMAMVGFNLVLTFSIAGIDWRAHIGGLVAGALTTLGMVRAPADRRGLQGASAAAVVLVSLALVVLGTIRVNG
ncbi:rhomboid family intramembrane serine protease [Streptomyces sp. NPDC092296]|uniref:rhomboid family intramembrane serine protease n=1 Tax=Streptomyces sp. NPDC092296 TaxID=3366012 RepID=UPI003818447B